MQHQPEIAVIVLNWNGTTDTLRCLEALKNQTTSHDVVLVDNASADREALLAQIDSSRITVLKNEKNLGFAGGVNTGIRYALEHSYVFIALINNDAEPERTWLEHLYKSMRENEKVGVATGKLLRRNGTIDSAGEIYTSWGLAYPLGRDEQDTGQYDTQDTVFGATGGASMYRAEMFRQVGLFDEDFFAYYEDVDLSFRARLAGWNIIRNPKAVAIHTVGASSGRVKDFTTYQTLKNLPWLYIKNLPLSLFPHVLPRFALAHLSFIASALAGGKFVAVSKALFWAFMKLPKKLIQRHAIQRNRLLITAQVKQLLVYDLPPHATRLRSLRRALTFGRR
ncbi:MAG TPA: glycosyltransferase family 2 protein [Candidatus Saccharibacteria bacterium]|jgi:GT2 family glycosyltransferase|nr:glycosyltransferase family 2 protein [Candidatus Saccharibacteria bacterium]